MEIDSEGDKRKGVGRNRDQNAEIYHRQAKEADNQTHRQINRWWKER